ncbi:LysR family transcriptional regulator [Marinomonas sp. FW-1]|uniref:LysR family transcriptional regulator n=1 Tax=Marinomonas sp. FW-1 TaxID=2071621 RepID=UPI001585DC2F|nr:LysR family transcriptional regulator [Marinomonas sp. FW-1]
MESKHLIYLSVILEKGSITAAAEHLNIAQPTLTRAMATLEMQAGAQLFTRSRFGVSSTPIGESLAREGRAITRTLGSAEEQVSRFKLGIKQNLRLAAGPLLSMEALPMIIERMLVEQPDIAITVTCLNPSSAIEKLMNDEFDIVIAPHPADNVSDSFHAELIHEDRIGIFCGKSHPLANKKNIKIDDFAGLDWLSLGIASYFEKQTTDMLASYGIPNAKTKVVFRNDAIMIMKMLSSGKFLAALPHFPVSTIKNIYSIKEIHLKDVTSIKRNIFLMCSRPLKEQIAFQTFKNIAHDVFSELAQENKG